MNRLCKSLGITLLIITTLLLFCLPALAITEAEVENAVAASGKEEVAGNVFIWFLCAVAFLKISQKIDSFMSSLGINVGHTGGSMLSEVIIASRGLSLIKNKVGGGFNNMATGKGAASSASFLSGGLAGVVGRQINNNAVKSVTSNDNTSLGTAIGGKLFANSINKGGEFSQNIISTIATGNASEMGVMKGDMARQAFSSYMGYSLATGGVNNTAFSNVDNSGSFSNSNSAAEIISNSSNATISSLENNSPLSNNPNTVSSANIPIQSSMENIPSYPDANSPNPSPHIETNNYANIPDNPPIFSNMEIGGGKISGIETNAYNPDGISFAMYNVDQYHAPHNHYTTEKAVDGSAWYKQYAVDTVDKSPYMQADGSIAYRENLIKKLPNPPRRKDKS